MQRNQQNNFKNSTNKVNPNTPNLTDYTTRSRSNSSIAYPEIKIVTEPMNEVI